MEIEFTNAPETIENKEEEVEENKKEVKEKTAEEEGNEEVKKDTPDTQEETKEVTHDAQEEPHEVTQDTPIVPSQVIPNGSETLPQTSKVKSESKPPVTITLASLESLPSVPTTAPVIIDSSDSEYEEATAEYS